MDAAFAVEDLVNMKRVQLQKLCKALGIKANSKTTQLVERLKEYAAVHYSTQSSEDGSTVVTEDTIKPVAQNVEQVVAADNEFKQEVLEKLDSKVKEKLPKSCIPRFVAKGVSVPANTTPGSNLKNWSKIHQAQFDKMDSIDVYLAKKQKRRENMDYCTTTKPKESRRTLNTKKSLGESAKKMFNPSHTMISKSGIFVFDKNRKSNVGTKTVTIQEKDGKSRLRSPKIFKASTLGFSFSAASGDQNKPKTPGVQRKSLAGTTPYRQSLGAMNTPAVTPTPRKKFDLQTSLAKPLSYKPYTGKLPAISHDKKDENKKQATKRVKVVDHKLDMKAVKVSTRDQRRNKITKNRVDKRSEAMSTRRRGLINVH